MLKTKKRLIILAAIILIFVIGIILYSMLMHFSGFSVLRVIREENSEKTEYAKVFGGLLAFNSDGIQLLDLEGSQRWNIGLEMQDPRVEYNKMYALVYDRRGTVLEIVNRSGEVGRISAAFPITAATLAENGTVAVVMQQQDVAHVILYSPDGTVIAEGKLHSSESGYPLAASISSNGKVLAISALHLSDADVKSDILFYDFTEQGSLKENNKSATFSFSGEVIPLLDHVAGDKVLAIGTGAATIFSAGTEPRIDKQLFFSKEIKSVVHNEKYFGIVTEEDTETGEIINNLTMYTMSTSKKYSKKIDDTYNRLKLLENDEVFITDGTHTTIITPLGIEKFSNDFGGDVSDMLAGSGARNYYLLQAGILSLIRIG